MRNWSCSTSGRGIFVSFGTSHPAQFIRCLERVDKDRKEMTGG